MRGIFLEMARSGKLTFIMEVMLHDEKHFWIMSLEKTF